jgi:hypothetical protein
MIYPDAESFLAALDTFYDGQRAPLPDGCCPDCGDWADRGPCRNCQRTFDGCINANGDHWLPCCSRCDHP